MIMIIIHYYSDETDIESEVKHTNNEDHINILKESYQHTHFLTDFKACYSICKVFIGSIWHCHICCSIVCTSFVIFTVKSNFFFNYKVNHFLLFLMLFLACVLAFHQNIVLTVLVNCKIGMSFPYQFR